MSIKRLQEKYYKLLRDGRELEMLTIIEKAIEIALENNDINKLIELLNDYGGALRNVGKYDKSILILETCRKLFEEKLDTNSKEYATTLMNLANAYRMSKDNKNALKYFNLSLVIYKKINLFDYSYTALLNNLALLYIENKDYEKAKDTLYESVNILLKGSSHKIQLATTYNNLYEPLMQLNLKEEALKNLLEANEILSNIVSKDNPLYASILNNLADYHYKTGEINKSLEFYNLSLNLIKNTYGVDSDAYKIIKSNIEKIKNSSHKKGLDLCEEFFQNIAKNYIKTNYPMIYNYSCFALVGEGSECLYFDDEISRDHNFDIRCNVFVPREVLDKYKIPKEIELNDGKILINSIEEFYKYYTLFEYGPKEIFEFRKVPQDLLCVATNGKVFLDNLGFFTKIRNRLLEYYPQDILLKNLAYCLNKIAQSGQYNYIRAIKRKDLMTAHIALSEFLTYYTEAIHLINKKYMPFYKWQYKSLSTLKILGTKSCKYIDELLLSKEDKSKIIENMCVELADYLRKENLSNSRDNFLVAQAKEVVKHIENNELKNENTWVR